KLFPHPGVRHVGPAIGMLHRGYRAWGDGAVPFEKDVLLPPGWIPKGTVAIDLVSVVAVIGFKDASGKPINVPLSSIKTWAGWSRNGAKKWFVRIQVEFHSQSVKFRWYIGMNHSFYFFA